MPVVRGTRNEFAPVEQDEDGRYYLDVPELPARSALLKGAGLYKPAEGETPFSVAWRFYRETLDRETDFRPTSLFDAICIANDIVNPMETLATGRPLFIPTLEAIFTVLRVRPLFRQRNTIT